MYTDGICVAGNRQSRGFKEYSDIILKKYKKLHNHGT